jgi:uncharacterized membrane protein YfcA
MDYFIVGLASLVVSVLALYSGFGLGTLLMPIFSLFFPIPVAVASTAAVHLSNNIFKIIFVGKNADWKIVLRFGIPAVALAIPGALILLQMVNINPLFTYNLGGNQFMVTTVNLVVAVLILIFAGFELIPNVRDVQFPKKYIPLGGALSGFFGGLSGHQGALRSAVLAKAGLDTPVFVGTASVCAMMVDVSRLTVYGFTFFSNDFSLISQGNSVVLVGVATVFAFLGTFISSRFIDKVTMKTVRLVVGILLVGIGIGLGSGIL